MKEKKTEYVRLKWKIRRHEAKKKNFFLCRKMSETNKNLINWMPTHRIYFTLFFFLNTVGDLEKLISWGDLLIDSVLALGELLKETERSRFSAFEFIHVKISKEFEAAEWLSVSFKWHVIKNFRWHVKSNSKSLLLISFL